MAVLALSTKRIGVTVQAQEDRTRGRCGHPPVGPGATVGRNLDVIGPHGALILADPANFEPGVALGDRERDDTDQRGRRVVEELVGEGLIQLRPRSVIAQGPDAGAPKSRPVDQVVAKFERRRVVVVELPPGGDAAVRRRAGLFLIRGPGRLFDRVVAAAILSRQIDSDAIDRGDRGPVLRPRNVRRVQLIRGGGPRPAVVGHAQDELRWRDPGRVGRDRVGEVVDRAGQRADRTGLRRGRTAVVVAHDEDRVGPTRRSRCLERVVADVAGGVEGQLIPGRDRIEFAADAADKRRELIGVPGHDRLEVEIHPVGTTLGDGRRNLLRQIGPRGRASEQVRLRRLLAARPGKAGDREDDPSSALVRRVDDRCHLRARPTSPAGGHTAVRVHLEEVAVLVGPDTEVGDRGKNRPIQ